MSHPWRWPTALVILCSLPFVLSGVDDADSLVLRLKDGGCEALPVLAVHHPDRLTLDLMKSLAQHEDPRLREIVGHQAWNPHVNLRTQLSVAATLEPASVRKRAMIWIARRTTSKETLTAVEIHSYWRSMDP